jgi:signal transduction histidine kinase
MRVLLIEDHAADARLIVEMIRGLGEPGIELEVADRLTAGCERAASEHFDAVLLDLELSDASGFGALDRCAAAAPDLPLVVLTGKENPVLALEALRRGAQDYVVKESLDGVALLKTLRFAIERKRLQTADHLLAETARLLAGTVDFDETLQRIGEVTVRSLADFCIIDLVGEDGEIRRLQVAHADPSRAETAKRLAGYPLDRSQPHLSRIVLESRESLLMPLVETRLLLETAQNEEHLALLTDLRLRSFVAAPLVAHERLLGVIVLLSSRRSYDDRDRALVERLAYAAALEIDNARLFRSAQEALRARDRVLAVVAHDLRNPLGAISMGAEMLLGDDLEAEQRSRQLRMIRRSAERMDRLIQDLLDVARIESGRLVLDRERGDPAGLVREALELSAPFAAARPVTLLAECDASAGTVLCDHERLVRVLTNLIGNAIRFTPPGGRIVVRSEPADGASVRFSVADTGAGIAAEDLPNLFVPFWQARPTPSSGAGLGLAIARGIVEAHGGRIWARSTLGEGTTMSFTVPTANEEPGSAEG